MIRYELPSDLTREEFHGLVTDIYYQLTKSGLDPTFNMVIGDRNELAADGTPYSIFDVFVSDDAALILAQSSFAATPALSPLFGSPRDLGSQD